MQVLTQAVPFAIGDSRNLPIKSLPFGDLALKGCCPFQHAPIEFTHKHSQF
jgi:hypothetical protein